ncbi:MAG: hypothetical protein WC494_00565 [Candidatus Pacearchaeota archaeon]
MKTIEHCLGYLKGTCPHCIPDEGNRFCPNYAPYKVRIFEVSEADPIDYRKPSE